MSFVRPEMFLLAPVFATLFFLLGAVRGRKKSLVPSLAIWADVVKIARRNSLWKRPRIFLSEVLLALGLVSLLFAAAGPNRTVSRHRSEEIVVVADLSASMLSESGGISRWERARDLVLNVLAARQGNDRVAIVAASKNGEASVILPFESDRRRVLEVLEGLEPYPIPVGIAECMEVAEDLLAAAGARASTDSPQPAMPRGVVLSDEADVCDPFAPFVFERLDGRVLAPSHNVGFVRWEAVSDSLDLAYTVRNFGDEDLDITVRERIGDESSERSIRLLAFTSSAGTVRVPDDFDGSIKVSIVEEDVFPIDNAVQASVASFRRKSVLVVRGEEEPDPFIVGALLACHPWIDPEKTAVMWEKDLIGDVTGVDLFVFDRVRPSFEPGVPSLWFEVPDPPLPLRTGGEVVAPAVTGIDGVHPVVQDVRLDNLYVASALSALADPSQTVLIEGPDHALAIASSFEADRVPYLYLAFSPSRSTLPYLSAFPLMIRNGLRWFFGDPRSRVSRLAVTGENASSFGGNGRCFTRPGEETISLRGRQERVSVNFIHPNESDVHRSGDLANRPILVPTVETRTISLDRWFIFAALLLLTADWLLFAGGSRLWFLRKAKDRGYSEVASRARRAAEAVSSGRSLR